jgi:hypothetical protein
MQTFDVIAESDFGSIRLLNKGEVFNILFNNIVLYFNSECFLNFKHNLACCYEENINSEHCLDCRNIVFNTRNEDMRLLFSSREVGQLLSMMQEAELCVSGY